MEEWSLEKIEQEITSGNEIFLYLYTPMCGTCQLASKMLLVVNELLPHLKLGQSNLNFLPQKAVEWSIESVPCLLIFNDGIIQKRIYAFQSVEYLYNLMKGSKTPS
ncbi:thioredoxin family protein [Bacillus timonensis]|nr:thioredoxin family protein [Bacillus timonensis]